MPLDNFISRGTEVFVTSTNPNYLQSVHAMVKVRARGWRGGGAALGSVAGAGAPAHPINPKPSLLLPQNPPKPSPK